MERVSEPMGITSERLNPKLITLKDISLIDVNQILQRIQLPALDAVQSKLCASVHAETGRIRLLQGTLNLYESSDVSFLYDNITNYNNNNILIFIF